jgi:hypothetical protein
MKISNFSNNKQAEKELKKTIPIMIAPLKKNIKYLGINLTQKVKDLCPVLQDTSAWVANLEGEE